MGGMAEYKAVFVDNGTSLMEKEYKSVFESLSVRTKVTEIGSFQD